MGGTSYNFSARTARAKTMSYDTASADTMFKQIKEGKIHESMDPKKIRLRESRDSSVHPVTFPVIFAMDVTGSMGDVPVMLIRSGLPTMVSEIMKKGITSPALLFLAVGDSQAPDQAPLQVAQFESGDAELDMWLTRTWPEGGGGGNAGESYLWTWYFAANHCETDHWDKRHKKGVLITFGDEPCLPNISKTEMKEVMDLDIETNLSAKSLLEAAQQKWEVFHISLTQRRTPSTHWDEWLGQHHIKCDDYTKIPEIVANLCAMYADTETATESPVKTAHTADTEDEEPIL